MSVVGTMFPGVGVFIAKLAGVLVLWGTRRPREIFTALAMVTACLSAIAATVLWWRLCLMPLGMLDEVEVFIRQLGGNVEAGWGVAMTMTVVRAVHTRRAREADLAAPALLLVAGEEAV